MNLAGLRSDHGVSHRLDRNVGESALPPWAFVEEPGSLLLIVPDELWRELLERGAGSMTVDVTPSLGSVPMSGTSGRWP